MDQHLEELDEECAQYHKLLNSLKEGRGARLVDKNTLNAKLSTMKVKVFFRVLSGSCFVLLVVETRMNFCFGLSFIWVGPDDFASFVDRTADESD